MKTFNFKGQVWIYPGLAGWHFVNLPKELSAKIKTSFNHYGGGFIKVKSTVGKSSWNTALFPSKQAETYLISINKKIRRNEGIFEGDSVSINIKVLAKRKNSKI